MRLREWIIALVVGLSIVALPALADEDKHSPSGHKTEHDAKEHDTHASGHAVHEPDPSDEVLDNREHWHFFHDFAIPLRFLSKFMIVELIAAGIIIWLMVGLGKRMQSGEPVQGPVWNAMEALVLFIRDEIARPNLDSPHHHEEHHAEGHHGEAHGLAPAEKHEADKFVPYLVTLFLFILFCNLLGLVPFMGSPTANIFVTGALALGSFIMMHGVPIAKMGATGYLKSMWLDMDIPPMFGFGIALSYVIKAMIFTIELFGTVIKSGVLAVRLFANMFAGHTVVASILFFIYATRNADLATWSVVTGASVLGVIALSLLELFVAFLQAYVFVFLTALFTGMAANPQH